MSATIEGPADWCRLVLSLLVVFGLFHGSATRLGSDRGQHGILVGALVVTATLAADRWLLRRHGGEGIRHLGLGRPRGIGVAVAGVLAVALWLVGFMFARSTQMALTVFPGAAALLPGLFMQAGIAEEVLFRAFLFGHIRVGRTFWRAAVLSMLPFVGVHLMLFLSMAWPVALASVVLAAVISFPLARLFELGGHTVWAPALLHFVIQGTVKVIDVPERAESFAIAWILASAVVPLLVFVLPRLSPK